jgi:ribosomal protein L11 methylase PrmA
VLSDCVPKCVGICIEAVEIDEMAIDHARENARLNGIDELIEFRMRVSEPARQFDLVLANIVYLVLLEHAAALCARQLRSGHMILSGLFGTDVPGILARFKPLLIPMTSQVYERGEWRAVVFSP